MPDRRAQRPTAPLRAVRTVVLSLATLTAATALISGCLGSGNLPAGPLGKGFENYTVVGQPVRRGIPDTIGMEVVFNSGPAPVIIDRLVLVAPRHIKLIGAYLTVGGVVGDWPTFPPAITLADSGRHIVRVWANRHRPADAIIPSHQWAGIALGLEPLRAHGTIAAIELFYHVGSNHYEWRGHMKIVLTLVPRSTRI